MLFSEDKLLHMCEMDGYNLTGCRICVDLGFPENNVDQGSFPERDLKKKYYV